MVALVRCVSWKSFAYLPEESVVTCLRNIGRVVAEDGLASSGNQ